MKLFYFGKAIYRSNVYLEILAMDISMNKTTTKDRFLMVLNRTLLNSHRKSRFKMFLNFSSEDTGPSIEVIEYAKFQNNNFGIITVSLVRRENCVRFYCDLSAFDFRGLCNVFRAIRSPPLPSPPNPNVPVRLW